MKLSKAQRRVLTAMAEPKWHAYVHRGVKCRAHLLTPKGFRDGVVRAITLEKLENMELIEDVTPPSSYGGTYYRITDAGREWVRQSRLA